MNTTTRDYQRFIEKVKLPTRHDIFGDALDYGSCWTWTGAKHGQGRGYGKFRLFGRVVSAHKASYIIHYGKDVQEGMVIAHLCNNECCVNPAHLAVQSQSENMRYAVTCGRHNSCK